MNEKRIWAALIGKLGDNHFAAAGIMGNLYAESALNPRNLQGSFEKKLGLSDDEYTRGVDFGTYTNFVRDGAGYGLAQWTYWSRKEKLLAFAKSRGASIGDLEMQLDYLWMEMESYRGLVDRLRAAKSVREASDIFMLEYERPKDQGESARTRRAAYGQKYYNQFAKAETTDKDTKERENMATVMIGSARIDENGNAHGGKAGDQTGREVSTQAWYKHNKGWKVFRAKDPAKAEKIAWDMQAACDNPHIGYDQYERNTLYNVAKAVGFDCAKVVTNCETDCSALVRVCCAYAGIMGLSSEFRTVNEPSQLMATGAFVEMTGSKYTDQSAYLQRGDILVTRTSGHTVVVLSNGSKAGDVEVAPVPQGLSRGDHGSAVQAMQEALLKWSPHCLPKWGADGDFGPETEEALREYQYQHNLPVTGVYDEATRKALAEKPVEPSTGCDGDTCPIDPPEGPEWVSATGDVNVRSAPGTDSQILGVLYKGHYVPYQGVTKQWNGRDWYLVEFENQNGWVSSKYARVVS